MPEVVGCQALTWSEIPSWHAIGQGFAQSAVFQFSTFEIEGFCCHRHRCITGWRCQSDPAGGEAQLVFLWLGHFFFGGVTCSSAWLVILRTLVQELVLWSWFVRSLDAGNCVVLSLDVARFAPARCVLGRVLRASPVFKF